MKKEPSDLCPNNTPGRHVYGGSGACIYCGAPKQKAPLAALAGPDLLALVAFVREVADEAFAADELAACDRITALLDAIDLDANSWNFVLVPVTWGLGEVAEAADLDAIADELPPDEDHRARLAAMLARAVRRG